MNTVFVAALAPIVTYFLSVLGLFAVGFYAIFRLKSTYIIREKIWSSFVGDRDFSDEHLKAFADEQLDLSRFRVVYGVPARSIADLHRLLAWMKEFDLAPFDVKRAREWINPSKNEPFQEPNGRFLVGRVFMLAVLMAALFATMKAVGSHQTLLKMRASGTYYWSDGKSVEPAWGNGHFDPRGCADGGVPDVSGTGFTSLEAKLLCDGIADGELNKIVTESIASQRRGFGTTAFIIGIFAIAAFLKLNSVGRGRQFARKLRLARARRGEGVAASAERELADG